MKPTIGRVVLYHEPGTLETELWPALVCSVKSETNLALGGFKSSGQPFSAVNVPLLEAAGDKDAPWAIWPPREPEQKVEATPAPPGSWSESTFDRTPAPPVSNQRQRGRPPKSEGSE